MSVVLALSVPSWSLPDWLTVIAFPGAVAALVIGGVQIRQAGQQSEAAARAARAAESAILRTEQHLADVQLVSLLLQIPVLQRDLELAVTHRSKAEAIRHLGDYGRLAAEARAILERRSHAGSSLLITTLRDATAIVGSAKNEIIAGHMTLEPATRGVRDHIGIAAAEATRIIGAMKAFTDTADHGGSNGK